MLKRIYADNFRALVNFEFLPGQMSLLLGENGSGKSSVFDVLGRLRDLVVHGSLVAQLFSYTRTHWDKRELQRFELQIEHAGGTFRYSLDIHHPPDAFGLAIVSTELVTFEDTPLYRFSGGEVQLYQGDGPEPLVFPFRPDRSFLPNIDTNSRRKSPRLAEFKSFMADLWILQPNPFSVDSFARQEQPYLARNGQDFASFFAFINGERPDLREEFERRLGEAMPGFQRFSLPRMGELRQLLAEFQVNGKKYNLGVDELSEGQRVLAILYAAASGLGERVAPVCFDEPDNFVSLTEIQPWLQLLRDTVETRGGQAMIISHHPEVMDYLALDSVWVFERPSGPVRVRPYEPDRAPGDEALKLSEIVARGM